MDSAVTPEHYTRSEILDLFDWSRKMLELLPPADRQRTYWTKGRRGKWIENQTGEWSEQTVNAVMQLDDWLVLDAALQKRRERAAATKTAKVNRFAAMPPDELASLALAQLHAINRRVKHYDRGTPLISRIYAAKDQALMALLKSARATLETFGEERTCRVCTGEFEYGDCRCSVRTWYIACCAAPDGQQYRFHMPPFGSGALIPADIAATAVQVAPHNPTQPAREVPESELGLMDQLLLIETYCMTLGSQS